jgi:hypothetical protein
MNGYVYIQTQDITGRWFTVTTVPNTDQLVNQALNSVQAFYKKRVRAITPAGSIVDVRSL